jgi:hypothetical protein
MLYNISRGLCDELALLSDTVKEVKVRKMCQFHPKWVHFLSKPIYGSSGLGALDEL